MTNARTLTPRNAPIQKRALERRAKILEVTAELLEEVGQDDLTTILVAKRAENAAAEAEAAEAEEDKLEKEAREHRKGRRYTGKDVERSTSRRSSTSDTSWGGAIASVVAKELKAA